MGKTGTAEHNAMQLAMQLHNHPKHPHWSESIEWASDRWDPLINAPVRGYPILHVRGRTLTGQVLEDMHYACGDGDGLMPPFDGWFVPQAGGHGFVQVFPVEWQPLRAGAAPVAA